MCRRKDALHPNYEGMFGFTSYGWRLGDVYVQYDTKGVRTEKGSELNVEILFTPIRRGDLDSLKLAEDLIVGEMLQTRVMPAVQEVPRIIAPIDTSDLGLTAELETVALPPYVSVAEA